MGNKPQKSTQTKLFLKIELHQIILHHAFNMRLRIGQMQTFPHGLDGLKLWDAGIVLARYVILHPEKFKKCDVLQLGSGVGIGGIAVKKWTQCSSITMSDYHPGIVDNMKKNSEKNDCKDIIALEFDWRKRQKMTDKYDIIMGSDIVYFGCPVKDLYQVFKTLLKVGGRGIIIIPERKNYAQLFAKQINKEEFDLQVQQLASQQYFQHALQDTKKSQYQYPLLKELKFSAYHLIRK